MISNIAELNAVYPRWRGELESEGRFRQGVHGLSPLARGTRRVIFPENNKARFIPAGAGNSRTRHTRASHRPVYPRWRGELGTCLIICVATVGLSPLARGTLISLAIINRLTRFIPAGAGNSRVCSAPCSTNSVYPRWRGELKVAGTPRAVNVGLSPLARGTH